jgi:hypothetical protein
MSAELYKTPLRIIMFAPQFAPFANPEAIVNNKLALAFLNMGWHVDIITRDYANNVQYDYGSGWSSIWEPLQSNTHVITYKLGNRLLRIIDIIKSGIRLGHLVDGCRWSLRALQAGMILHQKKPYHLILSRAVPGSAHLPAMKMARITKLPWIANWNDPWRFLYQKKSRSNDLSRELGYFHARFCRKVAKHASGITFPSEMLRKKMLPYLGENLLSKSFVVPHVALPIGTAGYYEKKNKIKFSYAGRMWPSQNPSFILNILKRYFSKNHLEEIWNFTFIGIEDVGLKNIINELGLNNNFTNLGKKGYLETLRILSESDILIVIDPPETKGMLLTSKFVDYVQAKRPILVISEKSGTLSEIISKYGGGIFADQSSSDDIEKAVHTFYIHWKECNLSDIYKSDELFDLFSPASIMLKYKEIIDTVCKK